MIPGLRSRQLRNKRNSPYAVLPQNLATTAGLLIEDFEDAAGWTPTTCTVADDAVNFVSGTQGVAIDYDGATTLAIEKTGYSLDLSAEISRNLRLALFVPSTVTDFVHNITIFITSQAAVGTKYVSQHVSVDTHSGWQIVVFPSTDWTITGGELWSNTMATIRIRVTGATATSAMTFDALRSGDVTLPAVFLSFDDAKVSNYTYAFDYMRRCNMVGTLYVPSDVIGDAGSLDATQLGEMYAEGWDVANHTMTQPYLTTLSQADQQVELIGCKNALDALGFTRASAHVAYPYGDYDATTLAAMAAESMVTGRTISGPEIILPVNAYTIGGKVAGQLETFLTIKTRLDRAITYGFVASIFLHDLVYGTPGANQWAMDRFTQLIDYIASLGIPCLTITQLHALQSGPLTVALPHPRGY